MDPDTGRRPCQGCRTSLPTGVHVGTPGKQLLFMGQEFGQRAEWSDERGVDWFQLSEDGYSAGIAALTADLNTVYRERRALWSQDTAPQGYSWIDANDSANNVLSFLRFGDDGSVLACIFNFAGVEHSSYRVGLPLTGRWRGSSIPTRCSIAAAAWEISGRSSPRRTRGTVAPPLPRWHCRRPLPSG